MLPPEVTSWSATGIGRAHLPIAAAALAAGGHLRVGMEDNLDARQGPARERTTASSWRGPPQLATLLQRPPMSTTEARALLAIKDRRTR